MEKSEEQFSLLRHRKNLSNNPKRYSQDKDQAINKFAEITSNYYGVCGKNKKIIIHLLKRLGDLVFETQEGKPLYEYEDTLPRAWNSHDDDGWKINYIKWEIGHLISLNQGGSNNPENLSFQSARCKQEIQMHLDYFETTEYNCKKEVQQRVNNLLNLHKSKEWNDILGKIHSLAKIKK